MILTMSSVNTASRTTRLGIKSLSVSFFTKLIKLIERTKNIWKSYDDTIYLTLTKEYNGNSSTNKSIPTISIPTISSHKNANKTTSQKIPRAPARHTGHSQDQK